MRMNNLIFLALLLTAVCAQRPISVYNNCSFVINVAVGTSGDASQDQQATLKPSATFATTVPNGWTSGRVWGLRPGYPIKPCTLAEFTFNSYDNLDFYDISIVDGFNLPMTIFVLGGTAGNCLNLTCAGPILQDCPAALQVMENNTVAACDSACTAFNDPADCCTGAYLIDCVASSYSEWFKSFCPEAYTFANDYTTDQPGCTDPEYQVVFCPGTTDSITPPPPPHINSASVFVAEWSLLVSSLLFAFISFL